MTVARARISLENTTIKSFVVANGSAVVEGVGVFFSAQDVVSVAVANSNVVGIALRTLTGDGVQTVEVAMLDGGIANVKCSGTATAGEYAIAGTDGFENQTLGGGNTVKYIAGQFMESGIDGDFVGMRLGGFAAGAA